MIADVFIRRPVLSTVCSLLIILAGAVSIPTLPIARYPDLAPPAVTVSAFYTGANAQAVESAVTTPLEQAINGVEGMSYITSSSTNSGFATITVTFDVDRDQDLAAVDVQNRVNQALGRMPAEVRQNGISVAKVATGFIGGLGFFSRDNRYSSQFISNYIDLYIRDAIKRVPGVGDVLVFGERKFAMRLWLDPTKLAGRNITAGDVVSALREQNVQVAAGALGDAPAAAEQALHDQRARHGPPVGGARVRRRRRQGRQGRRAGPRQGRRPRRARRRNLFVQPALPRPRSAGHRHFAAAVGERHRGVPGRGRRDGSPQAEFPARPRVAGRLRQRRRRARVDRRSAVDAARSDRPRHPGDVPVPAELAQHDHPGDHHPGVADRHVRVHQAVRLLDQRADAVRHRARHRHRRRRCDRGDREHRAPHARVPQDARARPRSTRCAKCSARWS